jgi:tetratricopeptide (TPR) repeat protein
MDLALANLQEAERLDPSNPLTRYQLGKRYRQMKKYSEARGELEAAVRLRPTLAPAFYQLGEVYKILGNEAKARQSLRQFALLTQREKTEKEDPVDANLEN